MNALMTTFSDTYARIAEAIFSDPRLTRQGKLDGVAMLFRESWQAISAESQSTDGKASTVSTLAEQKKSIVPSSLEAWMDENNREIK